MLRNRSSSSARAPKPARRSMCSICESGMKPMAQSLPDDARREERRSRQHPAFQRPVPHLSNSEIQHERGTRRFTMRAVDDVAYPTAVAKEIALNVDRIAQFRPDFALARPGVASRQ